jgi:hypothetical protein
LFDPFLALLFLVGLIVNLRRIRKPEYALNLIWLGTMLIPSMLADFAPSYKRTVGAIPPAVIVIALGIGGCWQLITWLAHRLKPSAQSLGWRIAALALMTGLIASTVTNTYAYFATWGQAGYLYTAFDTGLMTTGNYVSTLPNDERIYLSPVAADYPTFVVASLNRQAVHSFDGRRCTVLPDRPATPATYVLLTAEPARRDRRSEGILSATYPTLKLVAQDSDRDSPYFKAFGLPAGSAPVLKSMQPVSATFGDQIDLLGYDLGAPSWTTGQTAQLVIYWRARRAIGTNYTLFVHVTPDDETEQAARPLIQDDRQPCDGSYPTTVWPTDEVVVEFRKMDLPADLPPGKYTVSVGWYLLSDLSHLPVTSGPNSVGEDQFTLAQVQIGRP